MGHKILVASEPEALVTVFGVIAGDELPQSELLLAINVVDAIVMLGMAEIQNFLDEVRCIHAVCIKSSFSIRWMAKIKLRKLFDRSFSMFRCLPISRDPATFS